MKKIYEKPMVELTKFDVEDIITASGVVNKDASTLTGAEATAAVNAIKLEDKYDTVSVYNW